MSGARGFANHALYMARLLLDAWERELLSGEVAPAAIDAAFGPAVRQHLLDAVGWFLLATLKVSPLPPAPPHSTRELPIPGEGIALPGEVLEYRQLETTGWLGRLQTPIPPGMPRRPSGPVLVQTSQIPSRAEYREWLQDLSGHIERMSDSLEEQ